MNHALEGIPEDRVRFHICWGSWHGPHKGDVAAQGYRRLADQGEGAGLLIEAGNVRHEHEWKVWRTTKLPEGKAPNSRRRQSRDQCAGTPRACCRSNCPLCTDVGRENVIAGTDCGLGGRVHPQIAWAKLDALDRRRETRDQRALAIVATCRRGVLCPGV